MLTRFVARSISGLPRMMLSWAQAPFLLKGVCETILTSRRGGRLAYRLTNRRGPHISRREFVAIALDNIVKPQTGLKRRASRIGYAAQVQKNVGPLSSGVIKPNRLAASNHLTLPVGISFSLLVWLYERLFRGPCLIIPDKILDDRPLRILAPQNLVLPLHVRRLLHCALPETIKRAVTHQGEALRRGQIAWQVFEQAADDDHPVVDHIRPVGPFRPCLSCPPASTGARQTGRARFRAEIPALTSRRSHERPGEGPRRTRVSNIPSDPSVTLSRRLFRLVEMIPDLLTGAEKGHPFFLDEHRLAVHGVAARPRRAMSDDKVPKPRISTRSPLSRAPVISSRTASTAFSASRRWRYGFRAARISTSSDLIMTRLLPKTPHFGSYCGRVRRLCYRSDASRWGMAVDTAHSAWKMIRYAASSSASASSRADFASASSTSRNAWRFSASLSANVKEPPCRDW